MIKKIIFVSLLIAFAVLVAINAPRTTTQETASAYDVLKSDDYKVDPPQQVTWRGRIEAYLVHGGFILSKIPADLKFAHFIAEFDDKGPEFYDQWSGEVEVTGEWHFTDCTAHQRPGSRFTTCVPYVSIKSIKP